MSASDPLAALREFVVLDKTDNVSDSAWAVARRGFTESAPCLLSYVERLEAALVENYEAGLAFKQICEKLHDQGVFHSADRAIYQSNYHKKLDAVIALGREIKERRP